MSKHAAALVFADGGSPFPVALPFAIGRGADNALILDDDMASRSHATISMVDGEFFIRDEDSRNGTWVNGERRFGVPLQDGDQITIGETELIFRAELDDDVVNDVDETRTNINIGHFDAKETMELPAVRKIGE
jgi:pSer/pThr/pTyr-binding forkhead associated (FHA) protein